MEMGFLGSEAPEGRSGGGAEEEEDEGLAL